jgi:hypothetical protein
MARASKPKSVAKLEELGRRQLSPSFSMRDFLYSEIAAAHGLLNSPDDPDLAIKAGSRLCIELLEPLQSKFGRIAIRSAYRSQEVNAFGNERKYGCARNDDNFAGHIWDVPDEQGIGAMACIVVPSFWNKFQGEGDWVKLAWWIHDHLPYSTMEFFPRLWAFNLGWHEVPAKKITSFVPGSAGCLTKPGMANYEGCHQTEWGDIFPL